MEPVLEKCRQGERISRAMVYLRNREEMRAQFRIVPIHKPTAIQI